MAILHDLESPAPNLTHEQFTQLALLYKHRTSSQLSSAGDDKTERLQEKEKHVGLLEL